MGQATHIYDDVEGFVIGEEDTHTATVLHDSVIVEIQFVHRVPGLPVFSSASGSETAWEPPNPSCRWQTPLLHHPRHSRRYILASLSVGTIAGKGKKYGENIKTPWATGKKEKRALPHCPKCCMGIEMIPPLGWSYAAFMGSCLELFLQDWKSRT